MARLNKSTVALFFAAILSLPLFANRVSFGNLQDASIDFPEGFSIAESDQTGTSFLLQSSIVPVQALLRTWPSTRYENASQAMEKSLESLKLEYETEDFVWRNQDCVMAMFKGKINGTDQSGFALTASLPQKQGTVLLMAWTSPKNQDSCTAFMASLIDSLNIDAGSYYEAGPLTTWLYPDTEATTAVELEINGKTISTWIRNSDAEAGECLIDREYAVLTLYKKSNLWKQAWQRYYRMIFRDSFHRMQKAAFDIYNELSPLCSDDTDLAQKLLEWTQGFSYEREKNASDFASLPSILLGGGSDCDSRSMLLAVLLTAMNQDAIMLVSAQYSHAMAAITSSHPGHSFSYDGKKYLMGETTAPGLSWGKISGTQDNQSAWIPVMFP